MKDLENKVAIVTGGGSGIGRQTCLVLAEHGAKVAVADINETGAQETVRAIEEAGGRAFAAMLDASREDSAQALADAVKQEAGRIDILVNCAGIVDPTPIPDLTVERWDRLIDINLRGTHLVSQKCIEVMKAQKSGAIVNVSSQAGQVGGWLAGVNYSASKGGILAMTKAYARHLAPFGVRVNDVAPGLIATEMTQDRGDSAGSVPLGRLGTGREVANAIYFLASDLSSFITGTTIDVNGGQFMRS